METTQTATGYRRALVYGALACSLAFATAAAQREKKLVLAFEGQTVRVSGASPGKQLIAFGVGIGSVGHMAALTRDAQVLTDDDRDGVVQFTVRRLPRQSVWVAVELDSGDYVVATPTGKAPRPLPLPEDTWRGNRAQIDVARTYLEVLVVRPRVGAWTLRLADGGSRDADGVGNGVTKLRLDAMERLAGEEKGPPFAVHKDLLVVVDPHSLEFFVSEAH